MTTIIIFFDIEGEIVYVLTNMVEQQVLITNDANFHRKKDRHFPFSHGRKLVLIRHLN